MKLIEFIDKLHGLGVEFFTAGGELKIKSPKGVLTPELVEQIKERKEELKAFIMGRVGNESNPIPRIPDDQRDKPVTLSFAQQRLWFLEQYEPGNSAYNMHMFIRFNGALNISAMEQAFTAMTERHEVFRTTFETIDDEPRQVVHEAEPFQIRIDDVREQPEEAREAWVKSEIQQEIETPFDIERGPLLRSRLVRMGEADWILMIVQHHIISDGWSMGIFRQELVYLYNCFNEGREPALQPLPIQYRDYAHWQRSWLTGSELDRQLAFWEKNLVDAPMLQLPTDYPRPEVQTFNGAWYFFNIDEKLTERCKAFASQQNVSMFMLVLSVFDLLLKRYSGQDDFCVGSPIANRTRAELEPLIGFFVNTLVYRADLSGDPTFTELLQRTRQVSMSAYDHQDLPFELLVDKLNLSRNLSHSPVFQVMFIYQNTPQEKVEQVGELRADTIVGENVTSKFDLSVEFISESPCLKGFFEYNTDLFSEETIARLFEHFVNLLEGCLASGSDPISQISMLSPDEQKRLVMEFNPDPIDYKAVDCVHHLFEGQVAANADKPAVVFGDVSITYGELDERANRMANLLIENGVSVDSVVGVCLERSHEMVVSTLAVMKAGAAYVPIDPNYPPERISHMLIDSKAPVLITQNSVRENLPETESIIISIDDDAGKISASPATSPQRVVTRDNLAYVIYTSGSTGVPKGVAMRHAPIVNLLQWQAQSTILEHAATTIQFASLSFDVSHQDIYYTLSSGATLVVLSEEERLDAGAVLRIIQEQSVERIIMPFVVLNSLAQEAEHSGQYPRTLKEVITSGEQLQVTPAIRDFFTRLDGAVLHNQYGPAETHVCSCETLDGSPADWPVFPTIGKPIANSTMYILDEHINPVPVGVLGEIYIGRITARGYFGKADQTAEKFVPDPFVNETGARMYRTGDLARYLSDGSIEFLGRKDHQVKIRGFRIELGEIESKLVDHEQISEAVVIAIDGANNLKQLVAYVVMEEALTESEVSGYLSDLLPDYMVPSFIVKLDAIPVTANGKVNRSALPMPDLTKRKSEFVAPRTATELMLADVWMSVLELEQVSATDNFFELGGHSLLATQVVSRIRKLLELDIPVKVLFEFPTIEKLGREIDHLQSDAEAEVIPLRAVPDADHYPLSFAQQRLWFLAQLEGDNATYNMPAPLRLTGDLDVEALRCSLELMVGRHESLRTVFREVENQPVQVVQKDIVFELPQIDLRKELSGQLAGLGESEQKTLMEQEVARYIQQDIGTPFDLAHDLMFRAQLLQLGDDEYVLITDAHHIASDGWSLGVMVSEFSEIYRALVSGEEPQLEPITIQYRDFACWQREWFSGDVYEKQVNYWKQNLAGLPPMLELPTDRPRPRQQTHNGRLYWFTLPESLMQKLYQLGREQGATLFMTMLSAYQILMAKYSRMDDIAVGSPIANRTREELEGLIGFFVNTLTLRSQIRPEDNFMDLLEQVKGVTLGAYAHQDIPFETIVDAVNPERDLSHSPLFQVVFALQNTPIGDLKLPGVTLSGAQGEAVTAKFDLNMSIWESTKGAHGYFEYNSDLYDLETVEQMVSHYERILEQAVENPQIKIGDIRLINELELNQLVSSKQSQLRSFASESLAHQRFEQQAAQQPEALALTCGEQSLTYGDLNERANRLAHWLREQGVSANSLVGLSVERGIEIVIGILGILKAGGAYVPIDPNYPPERIEYILEDSAVKALLTQSGVRDKLPQHNAPVLNLDEVEEQLSGYPAENPSPVNSGDDLIYIIYTSGSTGKPKGVELTHRNVVRLFDACQDWYGFNEQDVWTLFHSYAFDFSVWEIWGALFYGGRIVVVPQMLSRSPADFYRLLIDEKVTVLNQTPSAFIQLIQVDEGYQSSELALRYVIFGGEALDLQSLRPWFARHGDASPLLVNMYGITETTVHVTYRPIRQVDLDANLGSMIGEPIPDLSIYLLDDKQQLVPTGVPGEICVGGAGVAKGYLNRPELTAERFIENPCVAGERLYRSGDLARQTPDGDLLYMGRIDNQVKVRGFRIELGEIESAITQHEQVRNCVVIVREDRADDKRLVAYVVYNQQIETSSELDESQVSDWSDIFAGTYDKITADHDPKFNFTGWDSSYSGQPIDVKEMEEWADATIERILALEPDDLLEIGSGTGLMLFRMIPHLGHYTGGDFAAGPIAHINAYLEQNGEYKDKIELSQREATDFNGWEGRMFDTVILNSIAQYFPSVDYLVEAIENALQHVKPGGAIFIGDNRHLGLLDQFHSSVELFRADDTHTIEQLNYRIQQRHLQEKELLLEPEFFLSLKKNYPQISHVSVMPKLSRYDNELSRYRYDAVLYIGEPVDLTEIEWTDWNEGQFDSEQIRQRLTNDKPEFLGITGIRNTRLQSDLMLRQLLDDRKRFDNAAALKRYINANLATPVALEELVILGESNGYKTEISWLNSNGTGNYQLVYKRADQSDCRISFPAATVEQDWHLHANNPARAQVIQTLVPELRSQLKAALPEHMVPSAFVLLETLPLTPHGKIDRRALPEPEAMRVGMDQEYVAPRNEVERQIAEIWCDVLGLEQVGAKDNFFELGGHSLLATQVISRLRQQFSADLTVRAIFESPTVEGLEQRISSLQHEENANILPPITRMEHPAEIPVSFVQRSYWFLNELEGGEASTYNSPAALRFKGDFRPDIAEQAMAEIVRRHETLRSTFHPSDLYPIQVIHNDFELTMPVIDLTHLEYDSEEQRAELMKLALEEAQRPFILDRDLLFRGCFIRLAEDDHVMCINMHHIVSDGWSQGVLVSEFVTLYEAFREGEPSPLQELPIQYTDFCIWQQTYVAGERFDQQFNFWKENLKGLKPKLELPTDHPRPPVQSYRGGVEGIHISRELTEKLNEYSRKSGGTLFVTLLAGMKLLLARYANDFDICVGTAIANRTRPELESMIGFFVNTLALRTTIDPSWSFDELLEAVKHTTFDAFAHPDVPFDSIVEAAAPERSLSVPPVFQVMFRLHNQPMDDLRVEGVEVSSLAADTMTAKLDLNFSFTEGTNGINGHVEYATDLYEGETISRMVGHYIKLLENAVSAPDHAVNRIPFLTEQEIEQVRQWNATDMDYPMDECMHEAFEKVVEQRPDHTAYVFKDESYTYRELNAKANKLAHFLKSRGVGPEVRVGLCVRRSAWMGIGALGAFKSSGTFVPLDPHYPADRLAHMVKVAEPKVILTHKEAEENLPPTDAEIVYLDKDWDSLIENQPDTNPPSLGHARHSCYILFTSGSTGMPKGILVGHDSWRNMGVAHAEFGVHDPDDHLLQFASLSFSISLFGTFMSWLAGSTLYQVSDEEGYPGEPLFKILREAKITKVSWPVSLLATLPPDDLPDLKTVISTAEPCTQEVVERWRQGGRRFLNLYGNSEVSLGSTFYEWYEGAPFTIGKSLPNTKMYLLDRELQQVPIGVTGEICTSGVGLARGYVKRPDATAEKFIPNPFSGVPGDRLYRTGDLGRYLPNGEIEFIGREDFQVSLRGFRIELTEVETVIREYENVQECAVAARPDPNGVDRLVAYILPVEGVEQIDVGELRKLLHSRLPNYMVPSIFQQLDEMPLTPNRKVDRLNLPAPDLTDQIARDYVEPETETQREMAGIWASVLNLEKVGLYNNFFEIGGHSLLATRVVSRMNNELDLDISIRDIFDAPTIEELAYLIATRELEEFDDDELDDLLDELDEEDFE